MTRGYFGVSLNDLNRVLPNRNVDVMITNESFQKLNPVGLLAKVVSRQKSGCLQVASRTTIWSIYIENGKLVYASNSCDPIGRIESHLKILGIEVSKFEHVMQVARSLFKEVQDDESSGQSSSQSLDYQVICWLVKHQCLTPSQAAVLIKQLAKEVMGSFLAVREGNYKLVHDRQFDEFPKFCRLDIRPLVEYWRHQARQRQDLKQGTASAKLPDAVDSSVEQSEPTSPIEQASIEVDAAIAPTPTPTTALPRSQSPDSANATLPPVGIPSRETSQPRRQKTYTIACIDDSPAVLQKIKAFLTDQDIAVLTVDNSVNALMQIVRNKPDLVLLDITMPNLDGYKLCSLLRKHPNFKSTPVIMVTGNTGLLDRAKAKLVGASGYLTKPFTQSDLIQTVFMHLS
jgi:two-component system, chemotaxis family, response regulator PixG